MKNKPYKDLGWKCPQCSHVNYPVEPIECGNCGTKNKKKKPLFLTGSNALILIILGVTLGSCIMYLILTG